MADKQLSSIRSKFVEKVNKVVISQLLDDLIEDGVLNDGEKEYITEENRSTAERARQLIDIVKKKGNIASRKMITHLEERDSILYSELGLSCAQPAPPAKENDDIYTVTKDNMKSRVALLITNIKFTNEKLSRKGAEKDEENMKTLLETMGYEVVKYTNLTGKGIKDAFIKFSKHPKLKETDSVWVVIMSHGKLGAILGVNWDENDKEPDQFNINDIYKHLDSENCPDLRDKPKIIIIQACRGDEKGSVLVSDSAEAAASQVCDEAPQSYPSASACEDDFEDDAVRCVHKEKDFIALLSCTPDTVSYRQPDHGSLLIRYLVDVFNAFAQKEDIEELFRKVMRRFEEFGIFDKRQMPTKDRCTLTKRFYVFPGL